MRMGPFPRSMRFLDPTPGPVRQPGTVNLGDLDPLDVEYILEALSHSQPPTATRMRLMSWFTFAICRCQTEDKLAERA